MAALANLKITVKVGRHNLNLSNMQPACTVKTLKGHIHRQTSIKTETMKFCNGETLESLQIKDDNQKIFDFILPGDTLVVILVEPEDNQVVPGEVKRSPGNTDDLPSIDDDLKSADDLKSEDTGDSVSPMVVQMALFNREGVYSHNNRTMYRYKVPMNNNSLFSSIEFIFSNGQRNVTIHSNALRKQVADLIRLNPSRYYSERLGFNRSEYCARILNPNVSCGGYIELDVFSWHYNLEICLLDCIANKLKRFGEANNYENRCILISAGLHYEPFAMHENQRKYTIFNKNDNDALKMAIEIANEAHSNVHSTDVSNNSLECVYCGVRFQLENINHSLATGHITLVDSYL